ncbi:MAG: hypothetical protein ACNYPD_04585 [Candidatus Halichondribacter symbioticus]
MTHTTTTTPTHFTLPAMITGLFILTACGGSALTNDAKIATNTQNDRCEANPLADGCQQAGAGFLSVGLDEGIGNQEAEPSEAPPAPKPVVNAPVAPKPVVAKTEPVVVTKTQPESAYSTYSSPAEQPVGTTETSPKFEPAVSAQVSVPATVTAATTTAFTDLATTRDTTLTNQFLEGGAAELDRGDVIRHHPLRMNLNQATYDGAAIGGDDIDGIDFFIVNDVVVTGEITYSRDSIDPTLLTASGTRTITTTRYHYAGILSGTDLGAPVDTAVGMATWNGSFRTHNTNPVDFQLTVGFGGEGERTISAFVKDGSRAKVDNYYLLDGTYDTSGLITGTVNWGTFSDIAMRTPTDNRTANGILRGLIGVQGAVGTFVSGSAVDPTNGKVTGGVNAHSVGDLTWGLEGYVGGFVASASFTDNPDVTFSDWTRAIPTVTGGNNGFEAGEAYGLGQTAITDVINLADCEAHNARTVIKSVTYTYHRPDPTMPISSTNQVTSVTPVVTREPRLDQLDCTGNHSGSLNLAGTRFREVTQSGVAFVTEGISLTTLTSGKSFAGLLSGTDLGAPITSASQVGEWKGQFKSVGGYYFDVTDAVPGTPATGTRVDTALDLDFTLTVTFSGGTGTVDAFVPIDNDNRHFYITGNYDDKGVITGVVRAAFFSNSMKGTHKAVNGVLTGLIGVEGAVGAFVSNADNYNYAGGFVANAITPDEETEVTFGDWTRSFATEPADAPTTGTPQSEFLQTTGSTLATGDLTARGGGSITVTTLDLKTATLRNNPLGGDENDGVAFYQGYVNTDGAGYAGIFSTTDLGAPISSQEASAQWHGQFQVIESRKINTDFRLEVTFGAVAGVDGSVGKVEAFIEQVAPNLAHHYVSGTFNNAGVIKGTATAGFFPNGRHSLSSSGGVHDGILTGLIGEDGAVGAFYSNTGVYAGGFVARPTVFVTYDTWLGSSFDTLLLSEADNSLNPINQFVQGGADMIDAGNVKVGNAPVTPITLKIPNSNSGVSFLQGDRGGYPFRTVFSAGILSGTNVGLPLDLGETFNGDAFATWNGEIRWVGALDNDGDTGTPGVVLAGSGQAARAFELDVNFIANTIEAFVPMGDNSHRLLLEAGYNAKGQFTNGTVKYGIFAGDVKEGARTASGADDRVFGGTLTGIIGSDGAVGAFISEGVPNSSIDFGFAGGFWAAPE